MSIDELLNFLLNEDEDDSSLLSCLLKLKKFSKYLDGNEAILPLREKIADMLETYATAVREWDDEDDVAFDDLMSSTMLAEEAFLQEVTQLEEKVKNI